MLVSPTKMYSIKDPLNPQLLGLDDSKDVKKFNKV